jgi:hypothetical protein
VLLVEINERLTPADHQTHRRYPFWVPDDCAALTFRVRYGPKFASGSAGLIERAVAKQRTVLLEHHLESELVEAWAQTSSTSAQARPVANLITVSLDDAQGAYRGAAHRQGPDAHLRLAVDHASPGLTAGPPPAGRWQLTMSVHTLVSPEVEVSIRIGAETASSAPSFERSSA